MPSAIPDLERRMSFVGIEDFLVLGVLEMAHDEGMSYLAVWKSIVGLYNERVARLSGAVPRIELKIVGEGDGNEG